MRPNTPLHLPLYAGSKYMIPEAPKRDVSDRTKGAETARGPDQSPGEKSALLVPINRVPFDIFQVIITMCQDETIGTFRFTISHVCHLWREYALVMPLLWNSLHINKRVPGWEMLEALLKRSGQAPLDIYIGQPPFVKSALPHLRKIMRMVLPHSGRWRTLHLNDVPYKVRRILLDQIRAKPAPHLEDIKISQSPLYDRPSRLKLENSSPNWRAENVFVGFPSLHSVEWTISTSNLSALPSFKNLKNITLGEDTLNDIPPRPFIQLIHRILSDSPSLETLRICNNTITGWGDLEVANLQLPTLTHHSLQALFIKSTPAVRSAAIRSLILPKLRTLSSIYWADLVDVSCCNIIAQDNSLPELRVITICGDIDIGWLAPPPSLHAHMSFLGPAIQNLVNLRVLTLRAINFDGGRWLPNLGKCCPDLRWLIFIFCTGYTIPPIRLMVETRMLRDGVSPLEILCIQPLYDAPPECWVNEEDAAWFSKFLKFKDQDDCWQTEPEVSHF
ncbi:hypothetical protein FS837_010038 [Tulasnella sp. UAMH 9824]|nr:hypothetical protein FS837_010038 [Tulasnella sp. UAMH 9824]